MDSVTQAALGAAIGGAILGKRLGRKAILMGAVLGTLPDLDVMLDYGDAVANVTEHRGFSHSLFVLTGLATIVALLCQRFIPARDISLGRWWCFFVLCLTTHPVLDSFTTYGTQLFWPLDMPPIAWPIVFIIDPFYTLPLLVALTIAIAAKKVRRACTIGLVVSSMYLLLAAGAKWSVEQRLTPALADAGLQAAPVLIQPTPFNIALWRATVIDGDRYFESLISVFDNQDAPTLEAIKRNVALEESVLASPLGQRLTWFTGPFLRYDTLLIDGQETLIATDIRLGFPGFHPFSFTLATWKDGSWHPADISEQLETSREPRLEILSRLAARAIGDNTALCASDFIEAQWRAEPSLYRC
ncbi:MULTISPECIES: metal-dependent hydrolase [unclassified Halomonas]|uniref:metal-dependent hydrolase n=1 Tax=Halomonas sp. N3-2A TaxID=2014541 RepID=UPI000B5B47BF|nr:MULTISPECIES: metal-dependent hydrolase [unclassified Halomonas]ASK19954.1 hydrolase [Halomonas sp. N3-2A]UTD57513.1 metal-dependent hydrolase [Halomonas sp. MS1]